ncbi:hypothetical protein G5B35_03050 [Parapusillimonas sp. SGNA-6]|nr:hypothetical protein [Parapusillimonas sp. SGNA-6]
MAHIPGKPVRGRISPTDVIVAAFFIALGMATIIAVLRFPDQPHGILDFQSVSFFPLLIAVIVISAALRVAFRSNDPGGQETDTAEAPPRLGRAFLAAFLLPLYAAAIFALGFWLSSSIAIVVMGLLLSPRRLSRREGLWLVAVAAVVPGLIIWVFDLFLAVKMPVAGGF